MAFEARSLESRKDIPCKVDRSLDWRRFQVLSDSWFLSPRRIRDYAQEQAHEQVGAGNSQKGKHELDSHGGTVAGRITYTFHYSPKTLNKGKLEAPKEAIHWAVISRAQLAKRRPSFENYLLCKTNVSHENSSVAPQAERKRYDRDFPLAGGLGLAAVPTASHTFYLLNPHESNNLSKHYPSTPLVEKPHELSLVSIRHGLGGMVVRLLGPTDLHFVSR